MSKRANGWIVSLGVAVVASAMACGPTNPGYDPARLESALDGTEDADVGRENNYCPTTSKPGQVCSESTCEITYKCPGSSKTVRKKLSCGNDNSGCACAYTTSDEEELKKNCNKRCGEDE